MDAMLFILPLVITIVVELIVLMILFGLRWKVLLASIPINIATNIPLNLFIQHVDSSIWSIIVGELIVIVVEALCYYLLLKDLKQAFIVSLLCNLASFLVGLLIEAIFLPLIT